MNRPVPSWGAARRGAGGFALIEILVTLVVLMVGLLGLVGLMVQTQRAQLESYQRVQALVVMEDMVNRLSINRKVASCYAITTNVTDGTPYAGTGVNLTTTLPTCTVGTAEQQARAIADLQEWDLLLDRTLVNARGCVTVEDDPATGDDIYKVSVVWQGGNTSSAPGETNCGKNLYGDDTQRRAVYVPMQVPNLSL